MAAPSLRLPYSADKCQLMVNVGTVDSSALGGGYDVGRAGVDKRSGIVWALNWRACLSAEKISIFLFER